MTKLTSKIPLIVRQVAEAYGFEVAYNEHTEEWFICAKGRGGAEFYWDSKQDEQDFFDELRSFFNVEGRESAYPY